MEEERLEMERRGLIFKEFYPVNPPFGFAGIQIDEETGALRYLVVEPTLTEEEKGILTEVKHRLIERIDIPLEVLRDEEKMEEYLKREIKRVLRRFRGKVAEEAEEKFIYYLKRDFLGYGKIDILMKDPNIEDISCNGVRTPIYVWHRRYESLPTNVSYDSEEELDAIVRRLAYRAGHQISIAHPILEGTLPEGYRIHLTLDEVSKRGNTFTIRKFRANPYTIIDLINFGTLSTEIAAYLWILIDNLRSIMICGATASGKTSLLNAIGMFIRPEMKVVTIEEVRELRLHENWIPMVTRPSFQPGVEEVSLYDLLRSALRQRPDYIIVGEVRGEEAYTLFQAIAVGHGGLCTIHADSVDAAIKRLLTKPMNIPKMMLPLMNVLILIRRVKLGDEIARRVVAVEEITGISPDGEVMLERRYEWNPEDDSFIYHPPSGRGRDVYRQIMETMHIPREKLMEEQARRERILRWMVEKGMNTYEEVSKVIRDYYLKPEEVYSAARMGAGR
ncbi:type II/IV secretion system ATPase subunit [Candidatus Bathyarchaeota archaeon]|nr:type II/IV secretion system ATPase subunit [Candidatus Bathyarchaeota archaeon]